MAMASLGFNADILTRSLNEQRCRQRGAQAMGNAFQAEVLGSLGGHMEAAAPRQYNWYDEKTVHQPTIKTASEKTFLDSLRQEINEWITDTI